MKAFEVVTVEEGTHVSHIVRKDAPTALQAVIDKWGVGFAIIGCVLVEDVTRYIKELDNYNGIVSRSHLTLRVLAGKYGDEAVQTEIDRQFEARRAE